MLLIHCKIIKESQSVTGRRKTHLRLYFSRRQKFHFKYGIIMMTNYHEVETSRHSSKQRSLQEKTKMLVSLYTNS